MALDQFKQIRSAFHPEAGTFFDDNRDIFHQLQNFICSFNAKSKIIFDICTDVCFDEVWIYVISIYCPVHMYDKEIPNKFRVDFFIMEYSKHYFI